jgi:diguanylate cyclase (GGDEF)-like protein
MTYDPPQAPVARFPATAQAKRVAVVPVDTLPLEAQLADAMRDGLAVFDQGGNLVRWNSSARAITGWTPGEAGQRGLAALPSGVIEIREGKWADARHIEVDGGTAVIFTDVTAQVSLRDANRRLDDLALTEAVTGLPNRRLALGQITRAIALAKRDLRPVGLLCIDIDGFTRLNHRLGDVAGDQILRQVGERIARSIRGSDMAARTAGDEFSVVLTAMGLPGDGSIVAVRLLLALAQPYRAAGETRTIGCSIGVAAYPRDAGGVDSLFKVANMGVRAAKLAGGGCYRDGTVGADTRPVIKTEVSAWASSSS